MLCAGAWRSDGSEADSRSRPLLAALRHRGSRLGPTPTRCTAANRYEKHTCRSTFSAETLGPQPISDIRAYDCDAGKRPFPAVLPVFPELELSTGDRWSPTTQASSKSRRNIKV